MHAGTFVGIFRNIKALNLLERTVGETMSPLRRWHVQFHEAAPSSRFCERCRQLGVAELMLKDAVQICVIVSCWALTLRRGWLPHMLRDFRCLWRMKWQDLKDMVRIDMTSNGVQCAAAPQMSVATCLWDAFGAGGRRVSTLSPSTCTPPLIPPAAPHSCLVPPLAAA